MKGSANFRQQSEFCSPPRLEAAPAAVPDDPAPTGALLCLTRRQLRQFRSLGTIASALSMRRRLVREVRFMAFALLPERSRLQHQARVAKCSSAPFNAFCVPCLLLVRSGRGSFTSFVSFASFLRDLDRSRPHITNVIAFAWCSTVDNIRSVSFQSCSRAICVRLMKQRWTVLFRRSFGVGCSERHQTGTNQHCLHN